MKVLKDEKCSKCGGLIKVIPYFGKQEGVVVSHGRCVFCEKRIVLPEEPYSQFVEEHCKTV